MGNGTGGQGSYPTGVNTTTFTGGLTQGSTVLTVGSTTGISPGQTVILTQQNASYVFTTGVEGPCTSGNSCGVNVSAKQFPSSSTWAQIQEVRVVSVNSGANQITIAAPGTAFTYQAGLSPVVFFWNTPNSFQFDGIENMTVNSNANGNAFLLSLPFCDFCWVKNVAMINAVSRGAMFFYFGYGDEADNNYVGGGTGAGGPTDYGIEFLETTFGKIQNNIVVNTTTPIITEGSYGLVAGYNDFVRNRTDNEFGNIITHLSHAYMQLFEGNVGSQIEYDNSWGSSSHMTSFRNFMNGHDPNATNFTTAMKINSQNHYVNVIGNVIGDPTFFSASNYEGNSSNWTTVCGNDAVEYDMGFWNNCEIGIDGANPYDSVSGSSLVRWGNWDGVTYNASGSSHHGTRYCTGSGTGSSGTDANNAACTASDTASTDPNFPGLSPPSTTIPPSFYTGITSVVPSCGTGLSFWKGASGGTCPPYPPIGPDVTCSTNCSSNTANHAALIPAQLCYNQLTKDGNGFITNFDANACYANDPTGGQQPPAPATSLFAKAR